MLLGEFRHGIDVVMDYLWGESAKTMDIVKGGLYVEYHMEHRRGRPPRTARERKQRSKEQTAEILKLFSEEVPQEIVRGMRGIRPTRYQFEHGGYTLPTTAGDQEALR